MPSFDVNVRAIVRALALEADAAAHAEGWELYDSESIGSDDDRSYEFRFDQLVTVESETPDQAVEFAKSDATAIDLPGYEIIDVTLWVDEGIDVTLTAAAPAP